MTFVSRAVVLKILIADTKINQYLLKTKKIHPLKRRLYENHTGKCMIFIQSAKYISNSFNIFLNFCLLSRSYIQDHDSPYYY